MISTVSKSLNKFMKNGIIGKSSSCDFILQPPNEGRKDYLTYYKINITKISTLNKFYYIVTKDPFK